MDDAMTTQAKGTTMTKPATVLTMNREIRSDLGDLVEVRTTGPLAGKLAGKQFVTARAVSGPGAGVQFYGETFAAGATVGEIEADIRYRMEIE